MLEKLLELLLSAKSGAVAAVFLIGTTGALVTATVENGVTTITVTPNASASPSATPSPTETATASPSPTETASASPSPSSSPSSSAAANCSDEAQTMAGALQEVNRAYAQYHSGLERLRGRGHADGSLTSLIVNGDAALQLIRTQADAEIHGLFTCGKDHAGQNSEDRDNENEDEDNGSSPNPVSSSSPTPSPTPTASPSGSPLVSGNDAKSVADSAVAAMKVVFDTVSAQIQSASPAPTHRPESSNAGLGREHGRFGGGDD